MRSPMRTAAHRYAGQGLSVIPVSDKEVRPLVEWKSFQERRATTDEITRWWRKWPSARPAIVTGSISKLLVVDMDGEPGHKSLCGKMLPMTPVVLTPGPGAHCWYAYPEDGNRYGSPVGLLPGTDIRSEGAFVLAPPSNATDPSLSPYTWADGLSPLDIQRAPCPPWIVALLHSGGYIVNNIINCVTPINGSPPKPAQGWVAWAGRSEFVQAAALCLGIPLAAAHDIGRTFCCVLPGHDERHPSASLYRMTDGTIWYRDWHERDGTPWYTLAEVYASQRYREAKNLSAPERMIWHLRMVVELGFHPLVSVPLLPLPASASRAERIVYAGFGLLLACRWLYDPGAPTPFTGKFMAAWTGLSRPHATRAFKSLLEQGYIQIVGQHCMSGYPINLYLPGTAHRVR